jgi:hypothetical protein
MDGAKRSLDECVRTGRDESGSLVDLQWRQAFKDLHLAVARVVEARAQRGLARAAQLPQLDDMTIELGLCGRRGHDDRSSCFSRPSSGG